MMRLDFEKKWWEHTNSFLSRNVALDESELSAEVVTVRDTHHFRLEDEKGMKLLELRRFSEDFLRYVEVPCQSVRIP